MLSITSNNHYRPLFSYLDLTEDERDGFEYAQPDLDEDGMPDYDALECRFVRAYGQVIDTYEFESISRGISVPVVAPLEGERDLLANWHAIQPGSAWHALVLRYDYDGSANGVAVGWAQW